MLTDCPPWLKMLRFLLPFSHRYFERLYSQFGVSTIKKIGHLIIALIILMSISACSAKISHSSVNELPVESPSRTEAADSYKPAQALSPVLTQPSAPAPYAPEPTWQEAYRDFLTVDLYNTDNPYLWFSFADIDEDNIPELYTLENTNDIMIHNQDNRSPDYEQGALINMYSFDGSEVLHVSSFDFGNSPGDFRFDSASNYIWHYSFNMSQGNIEEITAYSFENKSLKRKAYAGADSTVFAYNGRENVDDIQYKPSKREFEELYNNLSRYEGVNWWFIDDGVSYAIKVYEDWISYISQPDSELY